MNRPTDKNQMVMPGSEDLFESDPQEAEYLCKKCGCTFTDEAGRRLYFCDDCQPVQLGILFTAEVSS